MFFLILDTVFSDKLPMRVFPIILECNDLKYTIVINTAQLLS